MPGAAARCQERRRRGGIGMGKALEARAGQARGIDQGGMAQPIHDDPRVALRSGR